MTDEMTALLRQAARRNTGTAEAFPEPTGEPENPEPSFEDAMAAYPRAKHYGTDTEIADALAKVQDLIARQAGTATPPAPDFGAGARPARPEPVDMNTLLRQA